MACHRAGTGRQETDGRPRRQPRSQPPLPLFILTRSRRLSQTPPGTEILSPPNLIPPLSPSASTVLPPAPLEASSSSSTRAVSRPFHCPDRPLALQQRATADTNPLLPTNASNSTPEIYVTAREYAPVAPSRSVKPAHTTRSQL
ncbi:hypothetical protein L227DRAFT_219538 [Lentinus tigrinus ALCF2SS1-6]|uniref:Uncharacterized protein n=1 Tax=Lentinus tigrinus ALCF2SS1-6 TaxID=1328759 RepID=A0A5C2SQF1_9APHY|nr:hypothetical protein L227DRAFT_219538 [Lentinus tigrinus ALCF2SS1-6]